MRLLVLTAMSKIATAPVQLQVRKGSEQEQVLI